jgi:hypothetical protein
MLTKVEQDCADKLQQKGFDKRDVALTIYNSRAERKIETSVEEIHEIMKELDEFYCGLGKYSNAGE